MDKVAWTLVLTVTVAVTTRSVLSKSGRDLRQRGTTVFYDDFSSGGIDPQKWSVDSQAVGLGHFEIYSPEPQNIYVKDETLYVKPTLTVDRFGPDIFNHGTINVTQLWGYCQPKWGPLGCVTRDKENRPVISASLRSNGSFTYGRMEVVALLPKGDWLWPAIWMMPVESYYGPWPRSGEIDLIESTGNVHLLDRENQTIGVDCMHSHIHYGTEKEGPGHISQGELLRINGTTFGDAFYTYWLERTEEYLRIGVDNYTVLNVTTPPEGFWKQAHLNGTNIWAKGGKNAPFDRSFYLILNVALSGGTFWDVPRDILPWTWHSPDDYRQFWNNSHQWLPTWHGEDVAMKVKSVKMVEYEY